MLSGGAVLLLTATTIPDGTVGVGDGPVPPPIVTVPLTPVDVSGFPVVSPTFSLVAGRVVGPLAAAALTWSMHVYSVPSVTKPRVAPVSMIFRRRRCIPAGTAG